MSLSTVFSSIKLKTSILWHSAFFMVQLSHLYMTTGKTIILTIQIFVGKGLSLLFNMLSRLIYKSSLIYKPRNESFAYFSNSRT